ncbi:MAG: tyrosine-type recombinase/integrase [Nocardioidaceae bacterium]|nr:tyrosine-type recombinase/integrase [Nocardioidaceae bacterium]
MAGKKDRRGHNTGGLYRRKSDGMWVAAVTLPPAADGKRRRKVIVRAKYGDAQKALTKLRDDLERNGDLPTATTTLARWCDVWWERYAMHDLKVKTREGYRSKIENYIKPSIGSVRLDKLGPDHVHRVRDYITDRGLTTTTARGAIAVLSSILAAAEREQKIGRNPCDLVRKPAAAKRERLYLTNAQALQMLTAHDPADGTVPRDLAMWATAFLAGLRAGERLGLTRESVNVETGVLTVMWQLQRITFEHGCGDEPCGRARGGNCPKRRLSIPGDQEVRHVEGGLYLTRPKTAAGWREFTMPPLLTETLRTYLKNTEPGMCGLIFTRDLGRPIDPKDDAIAWDAALRAAQLPDVDRHSARHTCNTILTELGFPVDVRQKIIGHASKAVNEAVYTHTSDARVTEATAALGTAMDWRAKALG